MAQPESSTPHRYPIIESSGLLYIMRTLPMVVLQPAKIGLAFACIVLTLAWGSLLDGCWNVADSGVQLDAIEQFIAAKQTGEKFEVTEGEHGIFYVWREYERRCVLGLFGSSVPGVSVAAGTVLGDYFERHTRAAPLSNFAQMMWGLWWLIEAHFWYSLLIGFGSLVIWALGGGAICRMSAVEFSLGEKITIRQALKYVRERFTSLLSAPLIFIGFILSFAFIMVLFGLIMRIALIGDILVVVLFPLSLILGILTAICALGLLIGGSLLWPSIATDGVDAMDAAFARSFGYIVQRPWKAALYAVIAVVYASICWVMVNLFVFLSLWITRAVVSWGTAPFGWFKMPDPDGDKLPPITKIERLWDVGGHPNQLYVSPDWSALSWNEYISAFLVLVFVMIVIGLMWAFISSFYYTVSTIIYFLLRRDVDGTEMTDVYMDPEEEAIFLTPPQPATMPPAT